MLGGRSFAQRGLSGTPLEEVLPVELNDRRGGLVRASLDAGDLPAHNRVTLTPEGEAHPIMRIGGSPEETRKMWSALPALAASAPLGGPRPGATILALTTAPGGGVFPVVAVQRYGQGRSMVFAGEASWRWKMMVALDRSPLRVLLASVGALALLVRARSGRRSGVPDAPEPGDAIAIDVDARDASFAPVPDATIDATLTLPGGATQPIKLRHADPPGGRYTAALGAGAAGLYRVHAEARRGTTTLGAADRWMYVGGADREFADPRLNEGFLRRVARNSGGRYVRAAEASQGAVVAAGGGAAERRPGAPRSLARAVGVRARHRAAVGGVDPAPALGAAMSRIRSAFVVRRCARCGRAAPDARLSRPARPPASATRSIVTGASGGDAYAQKYAKWRASFVETLREQVSLRPAAAHRPGRDSDRRRRRRRRRARTSAPRSPICASG